MPPKAAVRVSWTGNKAAELHDRVPITRPPGRGTVVMSLGPGRDPESALPSLRAGDRLRVMSELEVTTDYNLAEQRAYPQGCAQAPYDYPPDVLATLILGADSQSTAPLAGTRAIAAKRVSVSHERHHEVIVFDRPEIIVPSGFSGAGAVNLVLSATHPAAGANQCLLIGENEPDGTPSTDMGGISVCRIRGTVAEPKPTRETRLRATAIKLHSSQAGPTVVYSMPLTDLKANEQMTIRTEVVPAMGTLKTRARLATRIFLADSATQTEPSDGYASQLAANKGRISKRTGPNYLPGITPTPTVKVGVLRILKNQAPTRSVYLNAVCDGGDPSKRARPSDALTLTRNGFIEVRRYPPALFG